MTQFTYVHMLHQSNFPLEKNGRLYSDVILIWIFMNEELRISIPISRLCVPLTQWCLVTPYDVIWLVQLWCRYSRLPDSTKPLHKTMLTKHHQRGVVAITRVLFHRKPSTPRHLSLIWVWIQLIYYYCCISQAPKCSRLTHRLSGWDCDQTG